jgi:aminoglycoside 6'-N-acetyltransferase
VGSPPVLTDGRVTLRPLRDEDLDPLVEMVAMPGVAEWWGTPDEPGSQKQDFRNDGSAFAVEVGGELAGWLAYTEELEPDYKSAGLDIGLFPAFHGDGIGPAALRLACAWLVDERGHHRLTIDPTVENARAIRAYEKVGFKPVGVLRSYERAPDGGWRDGLLMDLLADELVRAPAE